MADWQELDQYWRDIKAENKPDEREKLILEMVNQLLSHVVWGNERLQKIDDSLIVTGFLIEYLSIAKFVERFFATAQPFLDNEHKNSDFEKKIKHEKQKLEQIHLKSGQWREKHAEFLREKRELEQKEKEFDFLQEELKRFYDFKEKINPQALEKLREEVNALKSASSNGQNDLAQLEKFHSQLAEEYKAVEQVVKTIDQNKEDYIASCLELGNKLSCLITELSHTLDKRLVGKFNHLNQVTNEYRQTAKELEKKESNCKEMINKLDKCLMDLERITEEEKKCKETLAQHFDIDERSLQGLQEANDNYWSKYSGKIDPDLEIKVRENLKIFHACSDQISKDLARFDEGLGKLLQLSTQFRDNLRKLIEPGALI